MLRAHADDYYEQTGREQLSLTGITHCLATATKCVFYPPPSPPPPYSPLSCEEQRELLSLTDATEAHGITDCDAVHLHKADVAAACSGPSNEVECEELCARYYVYAPGSVQVCRGRRYQSDGSDHTRCANDHAVSSCPPASPPLSPPAAPPPPAPPRVPSGATGMSAEWPGVLIDGSPTADGCVRLFG